MPRQKRYGYRKQVHFSQHVRPLLDAIGEVRGMDAAALIREYVSHGITRDVVRLGIHLDTDPTQTNEEQTDE